MFRALALSASLAVAALGLPGAASSQVTQTPQQPYAHLHSRPIKALSDQQIDDLRAGRGMGYALPAELNGYPGPAHTLENADALMLSPVQRERTKALFEAMKAEAVPLGERLIQQEAELELLFAEKAVTPAKLEAATGAIGVTQGALRAAHLQYHLAMMEVLTPEQVQRYAEARGYGGEHGQEGHGTHTSN
jgi:Spy/CpxP family protein refolding chaperone